MRRGNRDWKPYYGGRGGHFQQPKAKPLFTMSRNNGTGILAGIYSDLLNQDIPLAPAHPTDVSFTTDVERGSFVGWKLYFPEKSFKDSAELVARVKMMESHFRTYIHWYNTEEIAESCVVSLNLHSLDEDKVLCKNWPGFISELTENPTSTLACIGLAMHNVVVSEKDQDESFGAIQHQKIYCRPIGFEPLIKLSEACNTQGVMISVTGTVKRVDPVEYSCKMACFRCSNCSTELAVKHNARTKQYVHPSSCHRGCTARGNFVELLSSPFTMYQPKQMIQLQELMYLQDQSSQTLNVELIQNIVNSLAPGAVVTVTGVVKHSQDKSIKFLKKGDSKFLKCYLKCFAVEVSSKHASHKREMTQQDMAFIEMMKAEPSPFRLLVHSLCPTIYGREEIKAGLVLSLLSGSSFLKKRRSESHILLVGNPGTGKSKLLQACAELSMKGQFVSGPTTTAVGLTASVGQNGSVEAGALMLADGGACCIDEFDKMSSHAHVLLESMEQQIISITKCGVRVNAPTRVVVIAAANPVGSVYDKTKTVLENLKVATPLLSRFDLIITLTNQPRANDQAFLTHMSNRNKNRSVMGNSSFFSSSSTSPTLPIMGNTNKLSWLYAGPDEQIDVLPYELLQMYIGYVREHIKPTLNEGAKDVIQKFFQQLRHLSVGAAVQPITLRQHEALMRLTLSRARADMSGEATREHAIDVINLFKFSMIDIFDADDPSDTPGAGISLKKPKVQNVSSMSKAKQIKALYEHLKSEVDIQDRDVFSTAEIKEMAKDLGIRDFYEIITKLNMESFVLQVVEGYRVV